MVWAVTAGIMASTIILYAATERSGENQCGAQTQKQSKQSQQKQMNSQGCQTATQAGVLYSLDEILGSDVKSKSKQTSKTMDGRNNRDEINRDSDGQSGMFGWFNDEDDSNTTTLGTVEDVILGDQKNEIQYVILESDNQNYPIPWQAFHVKSANVRSGYQSDRSRSNATRSESQNRADANEQRQNSVDSSNRSYFSSSDSSKLTLYLNLSKEQLKQAPTIDSITVEALSNSQLKQRVDSFYAKHIGMQARQFEGSGASQQQPQATLRDTKKPQEPQATLGSQQTGTDRSQGNDFDQRSMSSGRLFKATDIVGLDLKNNQDEDLGSIEDMVVDTRQGQIAYGLISFGGFMGMGQKTGVVPWSLVKINADLDHARIDATNDQLSAAVLEDDNIDKLSEAQFANSIHNNFNTEPYWQIYGYMPAEDNNTPESTKSNDWQRKQQKEKEQRDQKEQQR